MRILPKRFFSGLLRWQQAGNCKMSTKGDWEWMQRVRTSMNKSNDTRGMTDCQHGSDAQQQSVMSESRTKHHSGNGAELPLNSTTSYDSRPNYWVCKIFPWISWCSTFNRVMQYLIIYRLHVASMSSTLLVGISINRIRRPWIPRCWAYHFLCPQIHTTSQQQFHLGLVSVHKYKIGVWKGVNCSLFYRALVFCYVSTLHYITLSLFRTPFTPKVTSDASTKLCTTVSICQCKQMSFQLPFEITRISKFLESKLLLVELSNTIFSCVLIPTVGHLVASCHLNVSRFVIRRHLLSSCNRKYHAVQLNAFHLSAYD